ncbi:MAG TPA: glycine--tRNA ligase [Candidatus Dormibacteraeota bacterium]|nr:glycine--tRNA ligase [Candidatus Dormibacteraeota bacterium]
MAEPQKLVETMVSLAKRRGFIFQSSEIYGGVNAIYDFGPLGVALRRNIKDLWWRHTVEARHDVVGLESAIIMHPRVWEASGHVSNFTDPLVDCKQCQSRWRADHLRTKAELDALEAGGELPEDFTPAARKALGKAGVADRWVCPSCGAQDFSESRQFNLMFRTFLGPVEDSAAQVFLRPETAQGMFVQFQNVLNSSRKKIPFGIAQQGKSFRNEISPGNFIFRLREFEQQELEFFVKPGTDDEWFDYWRNQRMSWWRDVLGVRASKLRFREHETNELAHYAKAAVDVEYEYPFGWQELEGIANRTDFDLTQHATASGKDLSYFEEETKERYVPFVIEPAMGVDRCMFTLMLDAYDEEEVKGEKRVVLRFHPNVAPVQVAVLPLSKNAELLPMSRRLEELLRPVFRIEYDETQAIGRRYRRQDEIGTPFAVTIDFESLNDGAVTIRERDSMQQERVAVDGLVAAIQARFAAAGTVPG